MASVVGCSRWTWLKPQHRLVKTLEVNFLLEMLTDWRNESPLRPKNINRCTTDLCEHFRLLYLSQRFNFCLETRSNIIAILDLIFLLMLNYGKIFAAWYFWFVSLLKRILGYFVMSLV